MLALKFVFMILIAIRLRLMKFSAGMIKSLLVILFILFLLPLAKADGTPSRYIDLLPYVQQAPEQGDTGACLFIASTGAIELIANKKYNIKYPRPYGRFDLAESYLIQAPAFDGNRYFWEVPVLDFNWGYGIHVNSWSFEAWNQTWNNTEVWDYRDLSNMQKVSVPKVETIPLFVVGTKFSTFVLDDSNIKQIKDALVKYQSPVLVNYVDDDFWHVILIVGFDDSLVGTCYATPETECEKTVGSFYVRDSFGIAVEVRDYDWFKVMGNAAFVVKEAP